MQADLCFAMGERQRRLFPGPLRESLRLTEPCVDTELFSRAAARPWFEGDSTDAPLLTLDATGLDGAALAVLLRLAHAVLRALPACHAVMLTENSRLRKALEAAANTWADGCRPRFAAHASLPFGRYRDLLAASSLVVCPGQGDAAERAMLEALSCEALLMARPEAANFLRPGVNMLEFPANDAPAAVLAALEARPRDGEPAPQARMARRNVLAHFSEAVVVPRHLAGVMRAYAVWKKERGA
ncbi:MULTISPECIES: hypothetical protein [unclassified Desulfovibrio]|uniref:hypothetical protein n=1 Tax=unclassified Desulfovibrio TaxID=2593640 RepID=UPI001F15297D|nr:MULTISPECIES: hypothetical protein [unclassified Desulfovibrio]